MSFTPIYALIRHAGKRWAYSTSSPTPTQGGIFYPPPTGVGDIFYPPLPAHKAQVIAAPTQKLTGVNALVCPSHFYRNNLYYNQRERIEEDRMLFYFFVA